MIGFRHDIIREAVLDAAVPQIVTAMHRRAAAALAGEPAAARRAAHLAAAGDDDAAAGLFAAAATDRTRRARAARRREPGPAGRRSGAGAAGTRAAAADALAAVLAAQGRWAEALDDRRGHRRRERRHRRTGVSAWPRRRWKPAIPIARAPCWRAATTGCRSAGCWPAGSRWSAGTRDSALAEADAVAAQRADTDTRLAALDIRARALDFLDERTAPARRGRPRSQEADGGRPHPGRLRALFQLGKQEFFERRSAGQAPRGGRGRRGGGRADRAVLGRGDAGHRAHPAGRSGRGARGPRRGHSPCPRAAP